MTLSSNLMSLDMFTDYLVTTAVSLLLIDLTLRMVVMSAIVMSGYMVSNNPVRVDMSRMTGIVKIKIRAGYAIAITVAMVCLG